MYGPDDRHTLARWRSPTTWLDLTWPPEGCVGIYPEYTVYGKSYIPYIQFLEKPSIRNTRFHYTMVVVTATGDW